MLPRSTYFRGCSVFKILPTEEGRCILIHLGTRKGESRKGDKGIKLVKERKKWDEI
jgi:hypothetical protein